MSHDTTEEKKENKKAKKAIKIKKGILSEYDYLSTVDDKYFRYEFVKAQAKEILSYLHKLRLLNFRAWEGFIKDSIANNPTFAYDFYLKYSELDDALVIDDKRMRKELIMPDPVPLEDRQ